MDKILLIDDDVDLCEMLSEYLVREGFSTTVASTGHKGIAKALGETFDAIILDVMLPDVSGTEILRQIRSASEVPVLMLTAKGSEIDRVVGLEMGADDYVAKPYFPRELIARLRAILRRKSGSTPKPIYSLGGLTLDERKRSVEWNGDAFDLTTREFNILMVLLQADDAVATKDELSQKALGRSREHYDRSVDVHIGNLRRKLALSSSERIEIETVRGIGYRLKVHS